MPEGPHTKHTFPPAQLRACTRTRTRAGRPRGRHSGCGRRQKGEESARVCGHRHEGEESVRECGRRQKGEDSVRGCGGRQKGAQSVRCGSRQKGEESVRGCGGRQGGEESVGVWTQGILECPASGRLIASCEAVRWCARSMQRSM
eukprot:360403-Chlamydomonas_euryale.AAC.3